MLPGNRNTGTKKSYSRAFTVGPISDIILLNKRKLEKKGDFSIIYTTNMWRKE